MIFLGRKNTKLVFTIIFKTYFALFIQCLLLYLLELVSNKVALK